MSDTALAGGALAGVGISIVYYAVCIRLVLKRTPKHLARHFHESDSPVRFKVGVLRGVWDPAKPVRSPDLLHDPGIAQYSLDSEARIRLDLHPKHGRDRRSVGPKPEEVLSETEAQVRLHKLGHGLLIGYGVFTLVGAGIGAAVTHGSPIAHVFGGLVGAFIAWVTAWVVLLFFNFGRSAHNISTSTDANLFPGHPDPHSRRDA